MPGRQHVALIEREHSSLWVAIDSTPDGEPSVMLGIVYRQGQRSKLGNCVWIQRDELEAFERALAAAKRQLR